MNRKQYIFLNIFFAGFILAIFLYSVIFGGSDNSYPISCIHKELLGKTCPTCGMSRAFSEILGFHFQKAIDLQPNSIAVFSFFLTQLLIRLIFAWLLFKSFVNVKLLGNIDVPSTLILFLFAFGKILYATFYLFYKMMFMGVR